MWHKVPHDGSSAEYHNAKFGWRPLLDCRAVTLPIFSGFWSISTFQFHENLPITFRVTLIIVNETDKQTAIKHQNRTSPKVVELNNVAIRYYCDCPELQDEKNTGKCTVVAEFETEPWANDVDPYLRTLLDDPSLLWQQTNCSSSNSDFTELANCTLSSPSFTLINIHRCHVIADFIWQIVR